MFLGPATHRPLMAPPRRLGMDALCPGLVVLRRYKRKWLRADVLAGITVAAYAVPQVMAYAQIAGLPPVTGLLAMVAPSIAYLIFGSSRQLSVGPESTVALMTAAGLASVGATPETRAAFAAAFAIAVGILCLLGWLGGLGFLADLLSRPVLVGYMAGVAGLMILSQLEKLTGIPASGASLPAQAFNAVRNAAEVHWPTLALSAGLLLVLFVGVRIAPKLPHPLITVLLGAAVVSGFHLQDIGIKTVGEVPRALPSFAWPAVPPGDVLMMLGPALGIAVVAYSDNVLTARVFASRTGQRIDADQEFLAVGVSNVAAGLLQGFPVSSSGSRTAIGDSMGSRTQINSLVTVVTVLAAIFLVNPVLASFPQAALGALVVYAATRLIEVHEMRRVARFRRSEFFLLVATVLGVVLFGALNGILLAVALSLGDLLRRVARAHDGILGYVAGLAGMHDIEDFPEARQVPGLVVYRYDSPLFFANAEDFRRRAIMAVEAAPEPVEWLLLNVEANVEVDLTSLDAVQQLVKKMRKRGVVVALARVKQDLLTDLRASGLADLIGEDRMFPTLPVAVQAYLDWHEERHQRPHSFRAAQRALLRGSHQPQVPGPPLNGPTTPDVTQPP